MFLCENDRFERFDQSSTLKSDFVHKNIEIVDKVVLTMIRFIENMIFSTRSYVVSWPTLTKFLNGFYCAFQQNTPQNDQNN